MVAGVILKSTRLNSNLLQCVKVMAQNRSFTSQLTEQQLEVQELARNFSAEKLKPNAAQLDLKGRFPLNEIKGLTNLGLMGACVDQEHGGLGLDYLSLAVAVEEISRGCASTGMILSIHNFLYSNLVNERGSPEQKERFLEDFTKGSIGCFALSEPNAGSDVANIQTTARQDGDHWILNGKKCWVTSAVEGSAAAVFATFDPELRHKGLACFLVPLDTEGVFRGKKEPLMGVRAATSCDMTLQEVRVSSSQLVGKAGEGFRIAMAQLDQGRVGIAAHAVGIAQSALDTAIDYAKQRQAFGKNLTSLSSVQDRLTDMCILVETARLLTYRAATHVSTKNSAMAKYVAGRAAAAAADHCVQVLGGRGLSTHYSAERHYRDARGTQIYGGVTDIQKRLVGHHLLKEHKSLTNTDRLTDMCILVETARLLTYRAATHVSTKNSAMAKYVAGRAAAAAADHCVQVLGGRGLSTHYSAERHYRDARGTQIYGGVTDIQKRLVGHHLLKEHKSLTNTV